MKATAQAQSVDLLSGPTPPSLPPRPSPRTEPQDWLTGTDEGMGGPLGVRTTGLSISQQDQPVLRDSPSKRASFIERSPIALQKPLEAESVVVSQPAPASHTTALEREWDMALDRLDHIPAGKGEREKRKTEEQRRATRVEKRRSKSPVVTKAFITRNDVSTAGLGLQIPASGTGAETRQSKTPSPSGLTDNWSPVASPKRSRSKQRSMSSGSEDGPEDANGYVPKGGVGEKAKELHKVATKAGAQINGTGMAEGQRRRRTKSKSRQNSVHDLVDLWGGGVEKAKSPTTPTPTATKRSSVILPASTMKPPPVTNKPRSSSPQPLSTPASGGQSSSLTGRSSPTKHGKQPSSQSGSRRLPNPPAATSAYSDTGSGRARPSSMFIAPVTASKSTPGEMGAPSSTEAAAAFAQQALSPPDTPRSRKGTRRSSISDMVQRYEAIGGPKPPGPPAKPAALSLKTHPSTTSTASSDLASPSAAASRFPKLSPTTSPVLSKASLAVPDDSGRSQYGRDFAKHRTSPTGLPPRSSPVGRLETPFSTSYNPSSSGQTQTTGASAVNGLPSRRSPLEPARDQQPSRASIASKGDMGPPPSPRVERKMSAQLEPPSNANANVRSPSPEKPYQGVSKLIDRWQRAVDETGPPSRRGGGPPPKKAGMVSGGSGRG